MNNSVFDWSGSDNLMGAFGNGVLIPVKELDDRNRSSCLCKISERHGEGYIELLTLNPELSISIFNCNWLSPGEVIVNDGNRIRLNFSLELDIVMAFDESEGVYMNKPSWRLINNASDQPTCETYSTESRNIWVTLAFTQAYVETMFGAALFNSNKKVSSLFVKSKDNSVYQEYPLDYRLNQIVSNMISSHLDERLHLAYMESKANELICRAMDHILEEKEQDTVQATLRPQDEKAIYLAREILLTNLASAPSIQELCKTIGMNRNKLHYGFKQLFGTSISKHLQETRLAEAYRQLEMTDLNLLQIALNVGFSHQSSFSTAFRNQYGFSPHEVRKDH